MHFQDISHDAETCYALEENEQRVFFLLNRSGAITFELRGPRAAAYVFAFCIGTDTTKTDLTISQKHLAPHTTSRVLVKSVLHDAAHFSYRGLLHIAKTAVRSDASQENRNLLLSKDARAASEPMLEILTHDVKCHHAATTSPLNTEQLAFLRSRGLSDLAAKKILIHGFIHSSVESMETLLSSHDQEKVVALIGKSLT
jgi:Fe-S cluster assembly protein SufD